MKSLRMCAFFLFSISVAAQVPFPQIPITGALGPGGVFPGNNSGVLVFTSDADHTMVYPEMSASVIKVTSNTSLTAIRLLIAPLRLGFAFTVYNATLGGQRIKVVGTSGTGVTIANGYSAYVFSDGINYYSGTSTPPGYCVSISYSATQSFAFTANCLSVTLLGNITGATASGFISGNLYQVVLVQNSTGGFTFVPPSNFLGWPSDINRAPNGHTFCNLLAYTDGNLYVQSCSWI